MDQRLVMRQRAKSVFTGFIVELEIAVQGLLRDQQTWQDARSHTETDQK